MAYVLQVQLVLGLLAFRVLPSAMQLGLHCSSSRHQLDVEKEGPRKDAEGVAS